jgi:hypothetical protein
MSTTTVDAAQFVRQAMQSVATHYPGINVINEDDSRPGDLDITDKRLLPLFLPLDAGVQRPKPPNPYATQVDLETEPIPTPVPWIGDLQGHLDRHFPGDSSVRITFLTKRSQATDSTARQRRNERYRQEELDRFEEQGIDPDRVLVVHLGNRIGHSIVQLLTELELTRRGWVVASEWSWTPHRTMEGAPDGVAYRSPVTATMDERGLLGGGVTLRELACGPPAPRVGSPQSEPRAHDRPQTIVFEVKSADRTPGEGFRQLNKYIRSGMFDEAVTSIPGYPEYTNPDKGLLTFADDGHSEVLRDPVRHQQRGTRARPERKEFLVAFLDCVATQGLLANYTLDELQDIGAQFSEGAIATTHDLVRTLWSAPPEGLFTCLDHLSQ